MARDAPRTTPRDGRGALGRAAEDAAAAHLERLGYAIAARNVRIARFEIDLVALDGPTVVFVEVRSRSHRRHGGPLESVGPLKRRRLTRAASAFLARHRLGGRPARFDVIGIDWSSGRPLSTHVRNAFDAVD